MARRAAGGHPLGDDGAGPFRLVAGAGLLVFTAVYLDVFRRAFGGGCWSGSVLGRRAWRQRALIRRHLGFVVLASLLGVTAAAAGLSGCAEAGAAADEVAGDGVVCGVHTTRSSKT